MEQLTYSTLVPGEVDDGLTVTVVGSQSKGRELESRCGQEFFIS